MLESGGDGARPGEPSSWRPSMRITTLRLHKEKSAMMVRFMRNAGEFLAHRKGLPVLVGAGLVALNLLVGLLPAWPVIGWLAETDLLMHLGVIVGLLGILLGDAL